MDLPSHGTRARYRRIGCRCVSCSKSTSVGTNDGPLRWPVRFLYSIVSREKLEDDYPDELPLWKSFGLSDIEADHVAVGYGVHPFNVWPGYVEAGIDYEGT